MLFSLLALALAASRPEPAWVQTPALWFAPAHRIAATIAEQQLTPKTAQAIREILGNQSLADVSGWADAIKRALPATAPLHYVNIPLEAERYDPSRDCPSGRCVIGAIERNRKVLANPAASLRDRNRALKYLIHLVADLHQPLHVADDQDRGGTRTQVQFRRRGSNLHQVWDGELIAAKWRDEDDYLDYLRGLMDSLPLKQWEQGSVVDWAMEGHQLARSAYRLPRDRQLNADYVDRHLPEVDLALIKAGARLARVLNEALDRGER